MMIFVASLPTFQRLFPNFQTQCQTLYTLLLPIATVLIIAGLIAAVKHCQTPRSMVRPIVTSMMIVMAIALWGNWTDTAKDALKTVVAQMDANPAQAAQRYVDVLVSKEQPQQTGGWFGLPSSAQMYEAVLWGILSLIGLLAEFLIWAAYIIQQFLVGLAYAFAPLFIGFLALRSTSSIGVRYIMGTVGILAWCEIGKGEVANFACGVRVFGEPQHVAFVEAHQEGVGFVFACAIPSRAAGRVSKSSRAIRGDCVRISRGRATANWRWTCGNARPRGVNLRAGVWCVASFAGVSSPQTGGGDSKRSRTGEHRLRPNVKRSNDEETKIQQGRCFG